MIVDEARQCSLLAHARPVSLQTPLKELVDGPTGVGPRKPDRLALAVGLDFQIHEQTFRVALRACVQSLVAPAAVRVFESRVPNARFAFVKGGHRYLLCIRNRRPVVLSLALLPPWR